MSNHQFSEAEQSFMWRVLELAAQGSMTTQPNPRVGCVLVNEGIVVGEGFHQFAGGLHAEREALKQAGTAARGATAYVNLEPCCHQGRTPPCTDGLVDAGVVKVVAAMRDPNPLVAGGGFEMLAQAGLEVSVGLLEQEARWLNRGFVQRMAHGRPWVAMKSGATLDGRTADISGESQWITGSTARHEVQQLRMNSSAVVTGIGTVLADDPQLNVRVDDARRQPLRVLLDTHLRLPLDAKIIGSDDQLLVFTCSEDRDKITALSDLGVEVIVKAADPQGRVPLGDVLSDLAEWQCNEVLLEAGQDLSGAMLDAGLVDELILFYGGSLLGAQARAMFSTETPIAFAQRPEFKIQSTAMVGEDALINAVNVTSLERLQA